MWRAKTVALGLACLAASCGDEGAAPTELIVVVDTDLRIPDELDAIAIEVTGSDGSLERFDLDLDRITLPASLVLHPAGQSLGPIGIVATGRSAGMTVVSSRALTSFARGQQRVVHLVLWRACREIDCGLAATCDPGTMTCRDAQVAPAELPRWNGTLPRIHRPGVDGGPPPDGAACGELTIACSAGMLRSLCDGVEIAARPCPLGCSTGDPARCAWVRSSYVTADLFDDAAGDLVPPATLDTDACSAPGARMATQATGGPVCVLSGRNVEVTTAVQVVGSVPLIVLATGDVTISGVLDLSAMGAVPGSGGSPGGARSSSGTGLFPGATGPDIEAASGGGLCGRGGNAGSFPAPPAGVGGGGSFGAATPPSLAGGSGGGGSASNPGGGGGGAIAITARGTIRITATGAIVAAGGGGGAGRNGDPGGGGGAGAGSGGMIVLEAMAIDAMPMAILGVPGGGGGGGGAFESGSMATAGSDGGPIARMRMAIAPGGSPVDGASGEGGSGGGGTTTDGLAGGNCDDDNHSPGGGGGGAGCILLRDATGSTDTSRAFFTPSVDPSVRRSVVASE